MPALFAGINILNITIMKTMRWIFVIGLVLSLVGGYWLFIITPPHNITQLTLAIVVFSIGLLLLIPAKIYIIVKLMT
jgi:hypothetical protein